jgi:anti-sigma factor RsiW
MAFADGELDPPLASHIHQAIHADETLRRKHEIFRRTRTVLSGAFDEALDDPVPERLKSALRPH